MDRPLDRVEQLRSELAAGRYRAVLALFAEAFPEGQRAPSDVVLAAATAATRTGDFGSARRWAERALPGFRSRADDDGVMRTLNLLGAIGFEQGRPREAAKRFAGARALARRLGDHLMIARTSNNLASVAYLQGQVEGARSAYREALLAYQRLGHRRGAAETYHNLGIVARDHGELRAARDAGEHAVRHAAEVREPGLLALALSGRAETAVAMGELRVADEGLARATALAREAGDEVGLAELDRVRALRWWKQGDPDRALQAAEQGRQAAIRLGSGLLRAECAALAAEALGALGRRREASRRRAEARTRFEALGARLHLRRVGAAPRGRS